MLQEQTQQISKLKTRGLVQGHKIKMGTHKGLSMMTML